MYNLFFITAAIKRSITMVVFRALKSTFAAALVSSGYDLTVNYLCGPTLSKAARTNSLTSNFGLRRPLESQLL